MLLAKPPNIFFTNKSDVFFYFPKKHCLSRLDFYYTIGVIKNTVITWTRKQLGLESLRGIP